MKKLRRGINILQVNYTDLPGKVFNGYDLNCGLRKKGFYATQIVLDKYSNNDDETVLSVKKDLVLHQMFKWTEDRYSVSNVLYPYGIDFIKSKAFLDADIVHYHILHRHMFSLFDYPQLMNTKKVFWTIHDPWIVTGNCVHPLGCKRWKVGCGNCDRISESGFEMRFDCTKKMWNIKYDVLKQINPHIIVASKFMEDYLKNSPITNHFDKIHRIPFGINIENFKLEKRDNLRRQYKFDQDKILIGFRVEDNPIKGCSYIFDALTLLEFREKIVLFVVGNGEVREDIRKSYKVYELGWVSDDRKMAEYLVMCDIFLMPSLAESFGIMAMAAQIPIVCFKGTMIEELIDFSKCGLAVNYMSSQALAEGINALLINKNIRLEMGIKGRRKVERHYLYEDYVNKHKELYLEILGHEKVV